MKRTISTLLLTIISLIILGLLSNKKTNRKGFFYSKEINHLLKTSHYFSNIKLYNQYYEVYHPAHR